MTATLLVQPPDVMSKAGVTGAPEVAFLEPWEQLSY
jgi:hypothetical protein